MLNKKNIKQHGKLRLSQYFREFKDGERVAVVRELSLNPAFPERIQGRSGVIAGKKGSAYIVKIQMGGMNKTFILKPAHLKPILTLTK